MKKDNSLDNLNLLKFSMHILIFVCICCALIVFLIMPSFKSHEESRVRLLNQNDINSDAQTKLTLSTNKLEELYSSYGEILSKFTSEFKQDDFMNLLSENNFTNINISISDVNSSEAYLNKNIKINAIIKDPSNFYSFVYGLEKYKNLFKIDYPISFKSTNQNNIKIQMNLKLYSAPDLNR